MISIVVLIVGASALLLYTIAAEIRRERAFRRRNRALMPAREASFRGVRVSATQGRTTGAARSSNAGLDLGTVERNTPPDSGDSDLSSLGVPVRTTSRRAGCPSPDPRRTLE
jgi:hypothetical protein